MPFCLSKFLVCFFDWKRKIQPCSMLIQQYLDRATGKIKIYTLENYKRAPAQQPYETISLLETIDNHIGIRVFLMVLWHLLANPNWASCAAPALNQSHYSKQTFTCQQQKCLAQHFCNFVSFRHLIHFYFKYSRF